MAEDDWRLQGQERYLKGATLCRRRWHAPRPSWDHDHCEFCWAKFTKAADMLREGYTTEDSYYWICDRCFEDFRVQFEWTVAEGPC